MHRFDCHKRSRGFTVIEVTLALSLLAAGMVLTVQMFAMCARQRLASEQLLAAQWEASNVLEHLAALRYDELTAELANKIQPSAQLQAVLPGAKVNMTLSETPANTAEPAHKRIEVQVVWPGEENPPRSVLLTSWKYPVAAR
jgi:Tfp pilus assembly protein PilV